MYILNPCVAGTLYAPLFYIPTPRRAFFGGGGGGAWVCMTFGPPNDFEKIGTLVIKMITCNYFCFRGLIF